MTDARREDAEALDAPARTDAGGGRRPDASAPWDGPAFVATVTTDVTAEVDGRPTGKRRYRNGCWICGLPGHRQAECPNAEELVEKDVVPWIVLLPLKRRGRRRRQ